MLEMVLFRQDIFYCLDKNLNRDDIIYLLDELLGIPLTADLPERFTGESIVKGELANFVTPKDYNRIVLGINYIREKFEGILELGSFIVPKDIYHSVLKSKFHIPNDVDYVTVAQCVYPSISIPSNLPGNSSSQVSSLVKPLEKRLNDPKTPSKDKSEREHGDCVASVN